MKRVVVLLLIVVTILAACQPSPSAAPTQATGVTSAAPPTPTITPAPTEPPAGVIVEEITTSSGQRILFPKQAPAEGERETMEALLTGELVLEGSCLRVQAEEGNASYLPIWPPDFELNASDGTVQVLNGSGEPVVRLGEAFTIGGGEIPDNAQQAYEQVTPGLPIEGCPGLYWIVGDEIGG